MSLVKPMKTIVIANRIGIFIVRMMLRVGAHDRLKKTSWTYRCFFSIISGLCLLETYFDRYQNPARVGGSF